MSLLEEKLSARFSEWERRCRGWQLWTEPVHPEPAFEPFNGHFIEKDEGTDDGRRETALSSFGKRLLGRREVVEARADERQKPVPRGLRRRDIAEIQVVIPRDSEAERGLGAEILAVASGAKEPISFEIIATSSAIVLVVSSRLEDAPAFVSALSMMMPSAQVELRTGLLAQIAEGAGPERAVIEFGLAREAVFPIATSSNGEPLLPLLSALSALRDGEVVAYQLIFEGVRGAWRESMVNSVTHADGSNFFVNAPEFLPAVKEKTAKKLYAAVLRVAVMAGEYDRVLGIGADVAAALSIFDDPSRNALMPLENDGYDAAEHFEDFLKRQTRRSGMLLGADELLSLAHFPSASASVPRLFDGARTKRAPASSLCPGGLCIGVNTHLASANPVFLSVEERLRHVHVVGASGTGKSTLLFNMMVQDVKAGRGIALLDPHGDLCDQVLGAIPEERVEDVILIDPSDPEYAVGVNVLVAHSELERTLIASDLVSVFERLSTSWGDQLGSVLRNAILAFLESPQGGTLSDLRRFLLEPAYRESVLSTVRDPEVVYYWRKAFPALTGNRSIGPVITRLETFLAPKSVRYVVSQRENRFDLGKAMDEGKIILAKLSQGTIGQENSYLLGALIVSKIQQLAMARQAQSREARRDFFLYIDEFHSFITPSLAEIVSGSRKYRLGLVLAHQELRQLERNRDVSSAVLSNSYTRICFRVGDHDAKALASSLSGFDARDLQNLQTFEAVGRIERNDHDFNLRVALPNTSEDAADRKERIIEASRRKYGTKREIVEATLMVSAEKPAVREKPAKRGENASTPQVVVEEALKQPAEPVPTPDLGRGGVQHKAIQLRIKEAGEALRFRVHVEKQILDGAGQVDLVLDRGGQVVACEITVTNTIDYEVGNVSKCVKAGFRSIAVVGISDDKLEKLRSAVRLSLGEEAASRVGYFLPDPFIAHLAALMPAEPPQTEVRLSHGYKVKRNYVAISAGESKAKEASLIKHMAERMKMNASQTA